MTKLYEKYKSNITNKVYLRTAPNLYEDIDTQEERVPASFATGELSYCGSVVISPIHSNRYTEKQRDNQNKYTLQDIIKIHIYADEPVTFDGIKAYVKEQWADDVWDYAIVQHLNGLIRQGKVQLYEDGKSFTIGNNS